MLKNAISFSIIIPTYNRPAQLVNCLTALADQQYSKQQAFEVIVVNDGGASVDSAIRPFQQDLTITLINQQNTGPAQARNQGAAAAQGDFLVFTDDDCRPAPDWLQQLAKHCERLGYEEQSSKIAVMIGGQTINTLSKNLYSVASQMIVDLAYQYFNPQPSQARFFASNNMVFPREPFLKIGGFHPAFRTSEDREICDRWLRSGYRMQYVSDVKIYHAHRLSLASFWRQHLSYGRGAFRYHTIRTQRGEPPFRPDLSFQKQILIQPFKRLSLPQAVVVAGLMCLSQAASLVGYQQERRRQTAERLCETLLPIGFTK
ncbi:MAG: glycosyltransferase [Leptolyngbya sp. SIO4C1]|nr:glycosyltransferase [Leptolyngbya sp. SIO4C1]